MRNWIYITIACIFYCTVHAQQRDIDSLTNFLKTHPEEDSLRLEALNKLAFFYHQLNPDSGLIYAERLILLSEKLHHSRYLGKAYFNQGINYWAKGMFNRTLESYNISKAILEKWGTAKNVANLNNSMAVTYQTLADYPSALQLYFDNLKTFEQSKDTYMIALTCSNIGIVYKYLKQYDKSISFYQRAVFINANAGNQKELADNYGNIANVYEARKLTDSAIANYQRQHSMSKAAEYVKGMAAGNAGIGTCYIDAEKYAEAVQPLQDALLVYQKMGDKNNEATVLKSLGDVYAATEDKASAAIYFSRSLSIFKEIENIYGQAENWQQLATLYDQQQQYKKAFEAQRQYALLKDSIFSDEKKDAVTQMEMRYQFEKKEDSLKAAHEKRELIARAEVNRQSTIKNIIGWGSLLLFTAAVGGFILYKKRQDAKQQQQEAEFKTEVINTEMKALRAQMNPHFIFNSLNSIGDYIIKNNVQEADRYLGKFAKLMRMILENSDQKNVSLAQDLKALELYIQLEKLRMSNKFEYEIQIDEAINADETMVPPLILQPFVENSIWHGIAAKEGAGKLKIQIQKLTNEMINCMVEDDGIGREQSALIKTSQESNSLGMKITEARIGIINKTENTSASVTITDLQQGVRVEVKLPLIKAY